MSRAVGITHNRNGKAMMTETEIHGQQLYDELLARVRHYGETDMPFDMTTAPRQPARPEIDREAFALKVQQEIGVPLSWDQYVMIWDKLTDYMGKSDYLGELVPVDDSA